MKRYTRQPKNNQQPPTAAEALAVASVVVPQQQAQELAKLPPTRCCGRCVCFVATKAGVGQCRRSQKTVTNGNGYMDSSSYPLVDAKEDYCFEGFREISNNR